MKNDVISIKPELIKMSCQRVIPVAKINGVDVKDNVEIAAILGLNKE
jgi:hypothetical protein